MDDSCVDFVCFSCFACFMFYVLCSLSSAAVLLRPYLKNVDVFVFYK